MVYKSTDGGQTWATMWTDIGADSDEVTNVGIVYGIAWNNKGTIAVLQNNGDIRYDSNWGNTPWKNTGVAADGLKDFADLDMEDDPDNANHAIIWAVEANGNTYIYLTSTGAWKNPGQSKEDCVVAISVNEIPEFKDVLVPLLGTVLVVLLIRRKKRSIKKKS